MEENTMELKDLFDDDWYIHHLNKANAVMQPIIDEINRLQDVESMTVTDYIKELKRIGRKHLDPIADELNVSYHLNLFMFPTVIHKKQ